MQIAYYDQQREQLDPERTVVDTVGDGNDTVTVNGQPRHVHGYLRDFLFPPERALSPVKALSGGERNRLLLARLFTRPANVLVLDEPTNDLDIETLELLEAQLVEWPGTLLLVSHDRAFHRQRRHEHAGLRRRRARAGVRRRLRGLAAPAPRDRAREGRGGGRRSLAHAGAARRNPRSSTAAPEALVSRGAGAATPFHDESKRSKPNSTRCLPLSPIPASTRRGQRPSTTRWPGSSRCSARFSTPTRAGTNWTRAAPEVRGPSGRTDGGQPQLWQTVERRRAPPSALRLRSARF